jgi:riboflavin synthase
VVVFTGIVAAIGCINQVDTAPGGVHLRIGTGGLEMSDVIVGDSIAVNGVCLTVVSLTESSFDVVVSQASLDAITGFTQGAAVNLEKALRLADRLGGHLVSGPVDAVAEVLEFRAVGESMLLRFRAPQDLARYFSRKGSVTVQGVSLTVNAVEGADFEINLIPHTIKATTLQYLHPGATVNIEVDQIARYVERMLAVSGDTLKYT